MKSKTAKKTALVAMSGGIDSTATALLLREKGFDVTGIHFRFFNQNKTLQKVTAISEKIGVPLIVSDVSKEFEKEVIDRFVSEYKNNRTPNPCVICNVSIKFAKLLETAEKAKILHVATGHYVCLDRDSGGLCLKKSRDQMKDQSYFLYRLTQKQLEKCIFPLCDLKKNEIKAYLKSKGFEFRQKESQDICFFSRHENLNGFLSKHVLQHEGKIQDEHGKIVGSHQGVEFYTIGQRQGLNIGGEGPFYVFAKDTKHNILKVTNKKVHPWLNTTKILFNQSSWIGEIPDELKTYTIRTRYQTRGSKGKIRKIPNQENWRADLLESQWAVASGQSLVVYDDDKVMGGGIIVSNEID